MAAKRIQGYTLCVQAVIDSRRACTCAASIEEQFNDTMCLTFVGNLQGHRSTVVQLNINMFGVTTELVLIQFGPDGADSRIQLYR